MRNELTVHIVVDNLEVNEYDYSFDYKVYKGSETGELIKEGIWHSEHTQGPEEEHLTNFKNFLINEQAFRIVFSELWINL